MASLYHLDTNAFSDLMRGDPGVTAHLATLGPEDRVVICTIVRGEVLYGLERLAVGRRRTQLAEAAEKLFAVILCEPVPETAADHYAALKRRCEMAGTAMEDNDLWIAATAVASGAILVTRDSDHQKVTGLVTEDWSVPLAPSPPKPSA